MAVCYWPQSTLEAKRVSSLATAVTDRSPFSIIPIGSLHTGWALKVDGVLRRSSPSLIALGAYVDAIMARADEADADNIAGAIEGAPLADLRRADGGLFAGWPVEAVARPVQEAVT
jgi:hypothetical protein